jgi:hypothetical protein
MVRDVMACPHCRTPLRLNPAEYRREAALGFYLSVAILFNLLLTPVSLAKTVISFALLVGWLVFFRNYKRYLRSATLEINDRKDNAQDI